MNKTNEDIKQRIRALLDEPRTGLRASSDTNKTRMELLGIVDEMQQACDERVAAARQLLKHDIIKLLAGNIPAYEKKQSKAHNEGVTSGWYAAREFIRLEINPTPQD